MAKDQIAKYLSTVGISKTTYYEPSEPYKRVQQFEKVLDSCPKSTPTQNTVARLFINSHLHNYEKMMMLDIILKKFGKIDIADERVLPYYVSQNSGTIRRFINSNTYNPYIIFDYFNISINQVAEMTEYVVSHNNISIKRKHMFVDQISPLFKNKTSIHGVYNSLIAHSDMSLFCCFYENLMAPITPHTLLKGLSKFQPDLTRYIALNVKIKNDKISQSLIKQITTYSLYDEIMCNRIVEYLNTNDLNGSPYVLTIAGSIDCVNTIIDRLDEFQKVFPCEFTQWSMDEPNLIQYVIRNQYKLANVKKLVDYLFKCGMEVVSKIEILNSVLFIDYTIANVNNKKDLIDWCLETLDFKSPDDYTQLVMAIIKHYKNNDIEVMISVHYIIHPKYTYDYNLIMVYLVSHNTQIRYNDKNVVHYITLLKEFLTMFSDELDFDLTVEDNHLINWIYKQRGINFVSYTAIQMFCQYDVDIERVINESQDIENDYVLWKILIANYIQSIGDHSILDEIPPEVMEKVYKCL